MIRTQIYLTEEEKSALNDLAAATGRKESELVREAVDMFIADKSRKMRESILDETAGMWKKREDLPDFQAVREIWDR